MAKKTEQNIQKLANIFPQIQRFFHNVSIEVSKTGAFTIAQFRVLSLLDHYGKMTINELKTQLNIAQSSASGLVDRLEQLGLIKRRAGEKDKRITELSLTFKAKRILQKKHKSMDDVYRNILEQMNNKDQKIFVESFENLMKLIEKMESSG